MLKSFTRRPKIRKNEPMKIYVSINFSYFLFFITQFIGLYNPIDPYAQNLILVNLILVNFLGFLVITRNHERFEGRH